MLLYADDTIILAGNERDLQKALDSVQEYCTKFKLITGIDYQQNQNNKIFKRKSSTVHHVQIRL